MAETRYGSGNVKLNESSRDSTAGSPSIVTGVSGRLHNHRVVVEL